MNQQISPDQLVYEIGLLYVKLTIAERRIAELEKQASQPNPNSTP